MENNTNLIKTALTRLKMHNLAKGVGLIDHPKSQWKWALRNMRKANPKGVKNAPLMQKGKQLSDTKIKMGKLKNNELQKIKALQQKQKLGVEVGKATDGTYHSGNVGSIDQRNLSKGKTIRDLDTHTHPSFGKNEHKASLKKSKYSLHSNKSRLDDDVLAAQPSGIMTPESIEEAKGFISSSKREASEAKNKGKEIVSKWSKIDGRMLDVINKRYLRDSLSSSMNNSLKYKRKAKGQAMRDSLMNKVINRVKPLEASEKKHNRLARELDSAFFPDRRAGDIGAMESNPLRPERIVSDKTQGIHKIRNKLPNALRSVYFEGGLN